MVVSFTQSVIDSMAENADVMQYYSAGTVDEADYVNFMALIYDDSEALAAYDVADASEEVQELHESYTDGYAIAITTDVGTAVSGESIITIVQCVGGTFTDDAGEDTVASSCASTMLEV